MMSTIQKIISWMQKHVVVCFAIGAILVTTVFYFEVVFLNKTLLSTGMTAGVMGDEGPYQFLEKTNTTSQKLWNTFGIFHKDLAPVMWQGEPHQLKNREALMKWSWPLWNENNAVGKPHAANFISNPFFPLKVVVYLFPNATGWDLYLLLRFALGLFFMALFLREIGLRALPSFIGGMLFSFSGYFVLFQSIIDMDVGLLTPVVFWVASCAMTMAKAVRVRPVQYIVAIVSLTSLVLANVAEPLILVLTAGACYWAYLLLQSFFSDKKNFRRAFSISLKIIIPSILLVLPQYLLNYEFFRNSISIGHDAALKVGLGAFPVSYIFHYVFPYFNSNPYFKVQMPISTMSLNYVGLTVFFFSIYGVIVALIKRKIYLFLLILLLVCFGKVYGASVINELLGNAPGLGRVFFPKYIQPLISFAAASIAAIGLQGLMDRTVTKKHFFLGFLLLVHLSTIGLLYLPPSNGWALLYDHISVVNRYVIGGHLLLLVGISYVIISTKKKILPQLFIVVAGIIGMTELWFMVPRNFPTRYDSYALAPFLNYLQYQKPPFRIFGFNRILFPELATGVNLDDIRALDVLYIPQYYTYIKNFISPDIFDRFTGAPGDDNEAEPVQYLNNPLFDLLNVKYVLTKNPPLELFSENELNNLIFESYEQNPGLRETSFILNNDARRVFLEHAPNSVCVNLPVTIGHEYLKFSTGIHTFAWDYPGADGVEYSIQDSNGTVLFQFAQQPKQNSDHRTWIDHEIDLSAFSDTNPSICFITRPFENTLGDIAGWSNLRLTNKEDKSVPAMNSQYRLVYTDEVQIYENTHVMPRGFLVGSVRVVENDEGAVAAMKNNFHPRKEAVITKKEHQEAIPEFSQEKCNGSIRQYERPNSNVIKMKVNSGGKCLLVFSESNYPGWIAKVDGDRKPIYQTDLLLRGVVVGEGDHEIEFIYRPMNFYLGLIGSALGLLLAVYWSRRIGRERTH